MEYGVSDCGGYIAVIKSFHFAPPRQSSDRDRATLH